MFQHYDYIEVRTCQQSGFDTRIWFGYGVNTGVVPGEKTTGGKHPAKSSQSLGESQEALNRNLQ
jgi:hypothetical protein